MAAGILYPVYVRIPLYRNADDARAKRNVSSYITPTGSEVEGPGKFYIDNAVPDSYRPAVPIWFIHDTYGGSGYSIGWVNDTENAAPTTPSSDGGELGAPMEIRTPRVVGTFKHTLKYVFGEATGTFATGVDTSVMVTPPLTLANQIPNAISGTMTIICETYDGNRLIGTRSINVQMALPRSVAPSINNVTHTEAITAVSNLGLGGSAGYVRYLSKIRTQVSASGTYGSTIKQIEVRTDNQSMMVKDKSSADVTSDYIQSPPGDRSKGMNVYVTDSRGRLTIQEVRIITHDYAPPKINNFSAVRTNASGMEMDDGWNARVYYDYEVSPIVNKNSGSWEVYQSLDGQSWSKQSGGTGLKQNYNFITGVVFNPDNSYILKLVVTDAFRSVEVFTDLPTSSSVLDFNASKKGLAIGKASELDAFECAWPAYFTGGLRSNGSPVITEANNSLQYRGYLSDLSDATVKTLASGYYSLNASTTNATGFDVYSPIIVVKRHGSSGNIMIIGLNSSYSGIATRRVLNG